jgi:hypothetical protein
MAEEAGRPLVLPSDMDEEGHYFDFIAFYRWAVKKAAMSETHGPLALGIKRQGFAKLDQIETMGSKPSAHTLRR